jgi:uncharacterized protein YjiS (DUF1127 family)
MRLKRDRLDRLMQSIDTTIRRMSKQKKIDETELYDALRDDEVRAYESEVKARWGNTDAYKQSRARLAQMTKKQMADIKAAGTALTAEIAAAMDLGYTHPDVQALIAKHYASMQVFYDCSLTMYRNLGAMYVDDARFTAYYEKFRPGLAVFLRDAIAYFVDASV